MKTFITLFIILNIIFSVSCSKNAESTRENETSYENILDYLQVDSPNSFAPLGIGITIAPPEHGQNGKYFIVNKNIAESSFDYMNNPYIYRASKDSNALLSFYGDYTNNIDKNFTEDEYKIDVQYNVNTSNEKFTLWKINDIYYALYTKAEDDRDLTNLSSLYIKSVHLHINNN
ncbi:hypothetical protein [Brachyspira sp.]|uniref:hypothetical protein n=1 Tax=Brachyspira sp. TaxID=1977261 RepID=UPI002636DEFD|nr:hypothetical protein [Brachyspira sp.]